MGAALNEASVGVTIHDLLAGDQPLVTYKWIARHFNIPYDIAKQVLFHYVSTNLKVRWGNSYSRRALSPFHQCSFLVRVDS